MPLMIAYRWARRIAITVVGFTVLAVGIAMMVLPGPAFIVIPIGLGILGLEFAWARRWLKTIKERGEALARSVTSKVSSRAESRDASQPRPTIVGAAAEPSTPRRATPASPPPPTPR
jgi:uncharacterized protein (TIGR02611 family)